MKEHSALSHIAYVTEGAQRKMNGERITGQKRPLAINAEAETYRSVKLDNELYCKAQPVHGVKLGF